MIPGLLIPTVKYLDGLILITTANIKILSFFLLVFSILSVILLILMAKKIREHKKSLEIADERLAEAEQLRNSLSIQKDVISREFSNADRFFRILVESADDGISYYDNEWNLRFANSAFYSLIGYTSDSYSKIAADELIHPDDRDYVENRRKSVKETGYFEAEIKVLHLDGHYITISTRSVLVNDDNGNPLGSLTISRDITRLSKINYDLQVASREAESSNRLKASFLANISHEIRTPLNSVVGFSNLLLSDDLSDTVKQEYVEQINYNSEKLLQIIGDIIDLSRLESSQLEISYEEASLSGIINDVVEETRTIIRRNEKPVILKVNNLFEDNVDQIFTDKIWFRRVMSHLMDNAVKFTLDGSIELSYMREENNIVVKIKDTGIGINKENLSRIFEGFNQEISGHHRPFEGLGIGLTLAKEVISRMGGKINVQSEKGMGSEFTFTVPYRPAGSTSSRTRNAYPESLEMPTDWNSYTCLAVDDNKDVLVYLGRILEKTGINLIKARSGPEALEIVKSTEKLNLIILDMQMPEMNGIEATKAIREVRPDLPIIAQTAFVFEDDKDIILEAGCDACLIKPIRKEHLITVMSSFLRYPSQS